MRATPAFTGHKRDLEPLPTQDGKILKHEMHKRRVTWRTAREIRTQLVPQMRQRDVAERLGITHQAVEQIELRALTKIIRGFQTELADIATA